MKSITSQERAKHPAKRGDVLIGSGCRQNSGSARRLSSRITIRLSPPELADLELRAASLGMAVSEYTRDRLLEGSKVSRETGLVLAELGRVRELLTRFHEMNAAGRPTETEIGHVVDRVEALDPRVLVARALGVK